MDAGDLFVERIIEPYVGWPLLGVGGRMPGCAGQTIEVRFDGQPAAIVTIDPAGLFSTQLPIEDSLRRVSVALNGERLFDGGIDSITFRTTARPAEHGVKAKLLAMLRRGVRSILTGEILSPARWTARWHRFNESLLKQRQRLRLKLLRRRRGHATPHQAFIARIRPSTEPPRRTPVISILMPVFNVEPKWFRSAVQSVLKQSYPHWQLCIADDASTRVDLLAEFERLPDDPRIRFTRRNANGHICAASNSAADLATGEFMALLDHDDELASNALLEVARACESADVIYSDEDKIDSRGVRYDPQHKPEWSPELLLSYNYVNHFTVIRRSLFEQAGRFRSGFEGSQDHDLLLRVTERTERIVRIPKILYHWRSLPTSTASTAGVKTYVHTSGRRAVEDALKRRGIGADLLVPEFAQRLGLPVLALNSPAQKSVGVIIHGDASRAADTIRTLAGASIYLALDSSAESLNRLAATRDEEYLLFLEAGLIPREPDWLSRFLAYLTIPGVGAVGGRVNGSAGTWITDRGPREQSFDDISYYFYAEVARNVAAPSRGLLLTSREQFESLGGFDAERFPRTLFELDYCARLRSRGQRCVHVGDVRFEGRLQHSVDPHEWLAFRRAHGIRDPYSNPHFAEGFALAGDEGLVPAVPVSPLKALVAAHNLNSPEGAPRYLSEIVLGLRDRGAIDPVIVSPSDGAGGDVYRNAGVPVTVFAEDWSQRIIDVRWTPCEYETAQNRLISELKTAQPDVVIANTLLTFPVVEAAARLGIPSVWIIHESYSGDVLSRLFTPFARAKCDSAFALASRIIPASHDTAALFRPLDVHRNIRVIHNGIDPSAIDRYCQRVSKADARAKLHLDNTTQIIAVGTVCERKGQHALVEAASLLNRDDFRIHLVGLRDVVPYANYVRQLVRRRGVADRVNLVSETSDVFAWYRAADVFACTSHMETFSRAILEAEAFGLPIVSTPCEGIAEQVEWNQNALRFEKNDAVQLARHLELLIADSESRRAMGRKSRAVFDAHSTIGTMLDRYQAVLQQATRWIRTAESATALLRKAA